MGRPRHALLAVCVAVPLAAAGSAGAASHPRVGIVGRGWVATSPRGVATLFVAPTTAHVYATFVWRRPPSPGQKLRIVFIGPGGAERAAWTSTTSANRDRVGTRLWARIDRSLYQKAQGNWHVRLEVGKAARGYLSFIVTG